MKNLSFKGNVGKAGDSAGVSKTALHWISAKPWSWLWILESSRGGKYTGHQTDRPSRRLTDSETMSFTLPILIMSFSPLMAAVSQVASFDGSNTEQLYCEEYRQWTSLSGTAAALNRPLKPWVSGQCNVWSEMHSPDYSAGPRQVISSRLQALWELTSKTVTDSKYFPRQQLKG